MNLTVNFFGDIAYNDSYFELLKTLLTAKEDNIYSINLFINSDGGDYTLGMSIVDAIEACKKSGIKINTIGVGKVQSIAFMIYLAGQKRYAMKNTDFMFHTPSIKIIDETITAANFNSIATSLNKKVVATYEYIKERIKKNMWKKFTNDVIEKPGVDHYFTLEEMKQYGVVNEIIEDWSFL